MQQAVGYFYCGKTVIILPEPREEQRIRPRTPSKAKGRTGTRRAWKRKYPPYTIKAIWAPPHGQVMQTDTAYYMRAADYAALQARLRATY